MSDYFAMGDAASSAKDLAAAVASYDSARVFALRSGDREAELKSRTYAALAIAAGPCDTSERLVVFKVSLKKPETLHRQFASFIRESGQLIHTHRVREGEIESSIRIVARHAHAAAHADSAGHGLSPRRVAHPVAEPANQHPVLPANSDI
jgi:hypothetical protein